MPRSISFFASTLTLLALAGCHKDPDLPSIQGPGYGLERFASCEAMREYVADAYVETLLAYRYGEDWGVSKGEDAEADSAGVGDGGGSDGPSDYSETNVQELGVDEPDIVKTDGEYIYYVEDETLFIVDSWPAADSSLVAELPLGGEAVSMFLRGDQLVLFSYVMNEDYEDPDEGRPDDDDGWDTGGGADEPEKAPDVEGKVVGWSDAWAFTRVSIVDVADRAAPEVVRTVDTDGWYVDARIIEGDVYLVTDTWFDMPYELWDLAWSDELGLPELDGDESEAEIEAAREEARAIIEPIVEEAIDEMALEELLPMVRDQAPGEDADPTLLLGCTDVYGPETLSWPSVLTVAHIGLDGEGAVGVGSDVSATGVMSEGWTVYASEDHLFVAQTSWYWSWDAEDDSYTSHIHQFALEGADTVYEASGEVRGWLLNQFAMSEYDGFLRVATTDGDSWGAEVDVAAEGDEIDEGSGGGGDTGGGEDTGGAVEADAKDAEPPANNVFVMEESGGDLEVVGELEGIAPEEEIYAVRFVEDRGYVVTFEQTDPLFTIDLSDPRAPALVGELEIPGYSSYLHPLSDDFVLAIGMDGTEDGDITGLAVSLFDVSDFSAPALAAKYTLESDDWSYSEALYDHHAFTYHNGVLSFPAYVYDWDDSSGEEDYFSGIIAIQVDTGEESGTASLVELGRVDHADLVAESDCLYESYYGYEDYDEDDSGYGYGDDPCEDWYWYATMRRSVVIEENLYSISNYGVKVNELLDPDVELARVLFHPAE